MQEAVYTIMIKNYHFYNTKYGEELLIDLIKLETLEKYISGRLPHALTYYDITFITAGSGIFMLDDASYPVEEGTLFFTSPGQHRCWRTDKIPCGYVLIFEDDFLNVFFCDPHFVRRLSYFNAPSHSATIRLPSSDSDFIVSIVKNIQEEINTVQPHDKHILRALLYQVLVWLNRKYLICYPQMGAGKNNRYVSQFIELLEVNFREHANVGYYAQALCVTSGHLNDLVKKYTGNSAKKCIINRIMLEAKRMLIFTNEPVSTIATALNFEDVSYFSKAFQSHTHVTPLYYRQHNP